MIFRFRSIFISLFCFINIFSTLLFAQTEFTDYADYDSRVEDQILDEEHISASKNTIKTVFKPTALHILYQKEKERLDKLAKPNPKVNLGKKRKKNSRNNNVIQSSTPKSKQAKNSKKDSRRNSSRGSQKRINRKREFFRAIDPPLSTAKINEYSNIRNLDMADSSGNIVLYATSGDKFSINSSSDLNLTLEHRSSISLKNEEVILKSGSVINIKGVDNVIEVPNIFNINGTLLFDTGAQLTMKLTTDNAAIVFADGTTLDLEADTEFKISGDGLVTFGDGSTINLKGTSDAVSLYPSFIIDLFTTVQPADNSTLNIKGIGKVVIQDGGALDIRAYGGSKKVNVGIQKTDEVHVYVKGKGMIRLEGGDYPYRTSGYSYTPPTGYYGSLSFAKGTFSLSLKQGGILYIGFGGWLEFNSFRADPTSIAYLKRLDFGPDGNFYLNTGGILTFAQNDFVSLQELTTIWISDDAKILGDGGGLVEYIAREPNAGFNYQGFIGTFQPQNFAFKNISGLIPKDIAKKLVNQNTILVTAILYTDNTGTNKIRLKNGAVITFVTGDVITGEKSNGEVLAKSSKSKTVIYKLDGTRS